MSIGVTPADQLLARLDMDLAKRLGESVDPRVELIAQADLSMVDAKFAQAATVSGSTPPRVWLDDQTGEVLAVGVEAPQGHAEPGK